MKNKSEDVSDVGQRHYILKTTVKKKVNADIRLTFKKQADDGKQSVTDHIYSV